MTGAGTSAFLVRFTFGTDTGAAIPGMPGKLNPFNALVRAPDTLSLATLITSFFGCAGCFVTPGVSPSGVVRARALGAVSLTSCLVTTSSAGLLGAGVSTFLGGLGSGYTCFKAYAFGVLFGSVGGWLDDGGLLSLRPSLVRCCHSTLPGPCRQVILFYAFNFFFFLHRVNDI